jgi:hypothetical protein
VPARHAAARLAPRSAARQGQQGTDLPNLDGDGDGAADARRRQHLGRRADLSQCAECGPHAGRRRVRHREVRSARRRVDAHAAPATGYAPRSTAQLRGCVAPGRRRRHDAKLAARRARSKCVWDELAKWCALRKQHEPPASKLGVALRYFTNHQVALGQFLDYGCLPLDNGIVERLHVRTALTRKKFPLYGIRRWR